MLRDWRTIRTCTTELWNLDVEKIEEKCVFEAVYSDARRERFTYVYTYHDIQSYFYRLNGFEWTTGSINWKLNYCPRDTIIRTITGVKGYCSFATSAPSTAWCSGVGHGDSGAVPPPPFEKFLRFPSGNLNAVPPLYFNNSATPLVWCTRGRSAMVSRKAVSGRRHLR